VQGDPSGVAAHDLDHEGAVVALGRGVQPVDGLHRDVHRGVEAERVVGGVEVVVDGLGDPDDGDVELCELRRYAEGVLATDGNQRVDSHRRQVLLDSLNPTFDLEGVGTRRAENRAAARQDSTDLGDVQVHDLALKGAPPAVAEADELVPVLADALTDHGPNDRVEAGAVATPGQYADAHALLVLPEV
jgi:hypothetical protein